MHLSADERHILTRCAEMGPGVLHTHDFTERGQDCLQRLIRLQLIGVSWTPEYTAHSTLYLTDAGREVLATQ
jgi:hypothetical protein